MITEDYVSFETAKLLKEKGFDEYCFTYYDSNEGFVKRFNDGLHFSNTSYPWGVPYNICDAKKFFVAPTLQMTRKWLMEKQIFITIGFCDYPTLHKSEWIPEVCTHNSIFNEPSIAYNTYEEACEAAIKYCLENLI